MATDTIARAARGRPTYKTVLAIAGWAGLGLVLLWVLFLARDTPSGPLFSEPRQFTVALLNALTIAGLYFVVASGFTLIFGLMRVVNLAHGSIFLLGGYLALELQRKMVGKSQSIATSEVGMVDWLIPLAVAGLIAGVIGLIMQQVFLRWFQGQDMRETLITIAISVILADQMLARFGGIAKDVKWPGLLDNTITVFDIRYSITRLSMLAIALIVGVGLWLWLQRTRTGMVIRAGVDDTSMVQALGINVQVVFAVAFLVGSALAGVGGTMAGSFASLAPGVDGLWLLNSLVVVIIGGMGSLTGAAAGSLLLGLVTAFAPAYLPADYTQYSIMFSFVLLAAVLAFRPYGLFGKPA